EKYGHTRMVETLKINGYDLSNIKDNRFDAVATYSVLHHVPDYLRIIVEMIRVTKPGGIIYLDHEVNESYWNSNKGDLAFLQGLPQPQEKQGPFGVFSNHINRIRLKINPRYQPEGDIHVWPDDHIEWDKIEKLLTMHGCTIVFKEDYLHYKRHYPEDIYQAYRNKCNDMKVLIARKE
ncbi:MAG: class I SAM-dependent methyltransferase, partial [Deltaproteobacteria bacterium]|nr:class I SAM-dependent methyltransferase [Deltaproteobacteria bacterium]